jgi:hypothetical protein
MSFLISATWIDIDWEPTSIFQTSACKTTSYTTIVPLSVSSVPTSSHRCLSDLDILSKDRLLFEIVYMLRCQPPGGDCCVRNSILGKLQELRPRRFCWPSMLVMCVRVWLEGECYNGALLEPCPALAGAAFAPASSAKARRIVRGLRKLWLRCGPRRRTSVFMLFTLLDKDSEGAICN